jgi:hypothetical protein
MVMVMVMVMVFCGVNGIGLVKIRPEGMVLTSEYFKDQVVGEIDQGSHGSWQLAVGSWQLAAGGWAVELI